jgi:hypothetical protein
MGSLYISRSVVDRVYFGMNSVQEIGALSRGTPSIRVNLIQVCLQSVIIAFIITNHLINHPILLYFCPSSQSPSSYPPADIPVDRKSTCRPRPRRKGSLRRVPRSCHRACKPVERPASQTQVLRAKGQLHFVPQKVCG